MHASIYRCTLEACGRMNSHALRQTRTHCIILLGQKRTSWNGCTRMERTQTYVFKRNLMQSDRAATHRHTDEDMEERGQTDRHADGRMPTLLSVRAHSCKRTYINLPTVCAWVVSSFRRVLLLDGRSRTPLRCTIHVCTCTCTCTSDVFKHNNILHTGTHAKLYLMHMYSSMYIVCVTYHLCPHTCI